MNCHYYGCDEQTVYDPKTDDQRCAVHGQVFGLVVPQHLDDHDRTLHLRSQQARMALEVSAAKTLNHLRSDQ